MTEVNDLVQTSELAGCLHPAMVMPDRTIFLLSPAHSGGRRAAMIARPEASFELAERLRSPAGAPLGEVFTFLSGLYFRGKITYARRFAARIPGLPSALVITTNRGLMSPDAPIRPADLIDFAETPIDPRDARYREPLRADLSRLANSVPPELRIVLLGSIATSKYVELLMEFFGNRLCFPQDFVGMGDMQRGALLLRAAEAGQELPYISAIDAVRSTAKPRKPRAPKPD